MLRGLGKHDREKHFDMQLWGYKTACGTIACAAGHCGLDPWFRRRGFRARWRGVCADDVINYFSEVGPLAPLEVNGDMAELMSFSTSTERFFGMEGVTNIFCETRRRSVGEVIKEITAHIRGLRARLRDLGGRR